MNDSCTWATKRVLTVGERVDWVEGGKREELNQP